MRNEPCGQITFRISAELWSRIQAVANHYGITPEDHCRCSFGYYAALWRSEPRKAEAPRDEIAREPEAGAQIIPFLPHRAKRRWNIPSIA